MNDQRPDPDVLPGYEENCSRRHQRGVHATLMRLEGLCHEQHQAV